MLPSKRVFYDSRSTNPSQGDTVQIVIKRIDDQEAEIVEAVYLGSTQIEAYTTPYFKFLIGDKIRLVNANDVREWRFGITPPTIEHQLTAGDDEEMF